MLFLLIGGHLLVCTLVGSLFSKSTETTFRPEVPLDVSTSEDIALQKRSFLIERMTRKTTAPSGVIAFALAGIFAWIIACIVEFSEYRQSVSTETVSKPQLEQGD